MTECSETLFPFEAHFSRQVVAQFEGSWLTTEGGSLLLRQADRKIRLAAARGALLHRLPTTGAHRASLGRDAGATHLRASAGLRRPERSRAAAAGSAVGGVSREA